MGAFTKALGCCCSDTPPPCCFCDRGWEHDSWALQWNSVLSDGVFNPTEKPDPLTAANCNYRESSDCYEAETITAQLLEFSSEWYDYPLPLPQFGPLCPPCSNCAYGTNCPQIEIVKTQNSERSCQKIATYYYPRWEWTVEQLICQDCESVKFKATLKYRVISFSNSSAIAYQRRRNVIYACPGPANTTNWHYPQTPTFGEWDEPNVENCPDPATFCDYYDISFIDGVSVCTPPNATTPENDCERESLQSTFRDDTLSVTGPCSYSAVVVNKNYYQKIEIGGCNCNWYPCSGAGGFIQDPDGLNGPGEFGYNEYWESECLDCGQFPCDVTLTRRNNLGAETVTVVPQKTWFGNCNEPVPPHTIQIPATLTLNLTPCEDVQPSPI